MQRQHLKKEDELSLLQKEYLDQNENFLKLTNAFAENQRCITSLSKKCDENETLIESLMQEGLELKNLADLLRQEIDDKKTIIASLENECSEKTKAVSELQVKVEDLHLRLESLQNRFGMCSLPVIKPCCQYCFWPCGSPQGLLHRLCFDINKYNRFKWLVLKTLLLIYKVLNYVAWWVRDKWWNLIFMFIQNLKIQ